MTALPSAPPHISSQDDDDNIITTTADEGRPPHRQVWWTDLFRAFRQKSSLLLAGGLLYAYSRGYIF